MPIDRRPRGERVERGEALDQLASLIELALVDASKVVRTANDVRRQDEEQVLFGATLGAGLKQPSEHRDVAEHGDLLDGLALALLLQTTEDDRLTVAEAGEDHGETAGRHACR